MATGFARTKTNKTASPLPGRAISLPQSLYIATVAVYLCFLAVSVAIVFR